MGFMSSQHKTYKDIVGGENCCRGESVLVQECFLPMDAKSIDRIGPNLIR